MEHKPKYSLERIRASDGVELCGLFSTVKEDARRALLHVHGLAGNFYEQLFVDEISRRGLAARRHVLLFNNRGHDYFSDAIIRDTDKKTLDRGGAHERLDEAIIDIQAAVSFLKAQGVNDIVITAHSTGAVKAVHYLAAGGDAVIRGLALLSPSDDVGMQKEYAGERFELLLNRAKDLVANGAAGELMDRDAFFYPIDAEAYVQLFDPAGSGNVFDLTGAGRGLEALAAIIVPSLVVLGSEDIAVVSYDKIGAVREIVMSLGSASTSRGEVIDGASHDYSGYESVLGKIIFDWLENLPAFEVPD
jgi:pimeloyl-ACP methyl ester carboxylesterase